AAQYGQQQRLCAALQQHADSPMDGFVGYLNPPLADDPPADEDAGADASADASAKAKPTSSGRPHLAPAPAPDGQVRMARMQAPAVLDDFHGAEWFYQVCTEVGFYQVHNTDRTQTVLSSLIDQAYFDGQCKQVVGQTPNVAKTRATYYAPLLAGKVTNVLFGNGSLDPWSSLSFTDQSALPAGLTAFVVQQGSHGTDLSNLKPTSALGVFEAHLKFHDLAKMWIGQ